MITFKEGHIFKNDTSIIIYKDGVSLTQLLVQDFSLIPSKKRDEKRFVKLFKSFLENFVMEFLDANSEEIADRMEVIIKNPTQNAKAEFIKLFQSSPANLDEVFRKSYFELRKEELTKSKIENSEDIHEVGDELRDGVFESMELGNVSGGIGLLGIFFSKKYRYMSDSERKWEIKRSILKWTISLILTAILTWIVYKII